MKPEYEHLKMFPHRGAILVDEQLDRELPIPHIRTDNPLSFGNEFNLIRAVQEHAPQRIDKINEELQLMQDKQDKLLAERTQLQKLVAALG